jgi:hypothetical protein
LHGDSLATGIYIPGVDIDGWPLESEITQHDVDAFFLNLIPKSTVLDLGRSFFQGESGRQCGTTSLCY